MKPIYFALFVLLSFSASGQEIADAGTPPNSATIGFKLYPNPVYDAIVYIATANNGQKDIVVYDVFGEMVLTERITSNALNISQLVPGVYVLQVTENNKSMSRKLVVK